MPWSSEVFLTSLLERDGKHAALIQYYEGNIPKKSMYAATYSLRTNARNCPLAASCSDTSSFSFHAFVAPSEPGRNFVVFSEADVRRAKEG